MAGFGWGYIPLIFINVLIELFIVDHLIITTKQVWEISEN